MYKILGSDQKEYGPVSAQQIIQWIHEGRANGATLARAEGTEAWVPLVNIPEFASLFAGRPAAVPVAVPPGPPPNADELAARIGATDYDLDITGCIGAGWRLLWDNFGPIFGGTLVFLLIVGVIWLFGFIPLIGPLISFGSIFLTGPLIGGLYMLYLRRIRKQGGEVGDIFSGFSDRYWHLVLANLVPGLLMGLSVIPGAILIGFGVVGMGIHLSASAGVTTSAGVAGGALLLLILGIFIALVPFVYLSISWLFTVPIVIDKRIGFWEAMGLSHRMVRKHFVSVLALLILCALINFVGMACCVGMLFTGPIVAGAMMYAYETIFSGRSPQAT